VKSPHSQARLLRDLKRHVQTVNPGSEPFASGLKSIEQTAWALVILRGIEWTALGTRTEYTYKAHTYVSTPDGQEETHVTPDPAPKVRIDTPYQMGVRRMASKSLAQYDRTVRWVFDRFDDALDAELNGRTRLRTLTGRAAFETLVNKRITEVEGLVAGRKPASNSRMAEFIKRHGQVHVYRDQMYSSKREALLAVREDNATLPVDHDLIVDLTEQAFPPEGFVEEKYDELLRYVRSKDHKDALKESSGVPNTLLRRHDRIVKMIASAQRRLAGLSDPLPLKLYDKIGVSKSYLTKLLQGKPKDKAGVREALREAMFELCPSKRPRTRKGEPVAAQPSSEVPSMAPCPPGCRCVRHQ
jgi:hypothetical protein